MAGANPWWELWGWPADQPAPLLFRDGESHPLLLALIRDLDGANLAIHSRDEMLRYFYFDHGQDAGRALAMYFQSGLEIWSAFRRVLEWRFGRLGGGRGGARLRERLRPGDPLRGAGPAGRPAAGRPTSIPRRCASWRRSSACRPSSPAPGRRTSPARRRSTRSSSPRSSPTCRRARSTPGSGGWPRWSAREGCSPSASTTRGSSPPPAAAERPAVRGGERERDARPRRVRHLLGHRRLRPRRRGAGRLRAPRRSGCRAASPTSRTSTSWSASRASTSPPSTRRWRRSASSSAAPKPLPAGWSSAAGWRTARRACRRARCARRSTGSCSASCLDLPPRPDVAPLYRQEAVQPAGWRLALRLPAGSPRDAARLAVRVVDAGGREWTLDERPVDSALLRSARLDLYATTEALERTRAESAALLERERAAAAAEAAGLEARIAGMQASRFWKLRDRWFRLKRRLGLTDEA